jgi:hypothetical protein
MFDEVPCGGDLPDIEGRIGLFFGQLVELRDVRRIDPLFG